MLKISNFSKRYKNGKKVVENLSLDVEKGDLYGFIGHNGAGKTTTIKAIVGILDFEEGEIRIDNHSIKNEPLICKKMLAYIPDNPDLYEHLSGIQYINFIGDIFGVSQSQRDRLIGKYANEFEIMDRLGDIISTYSHGMKQKLAIISALIHEPKLLILDEPFVGLDPKAAHTLKGIMKDFCKSGGSIFFSTHVLEVAEKLCNKIAILKEGKLLTSGEISKVKGSSSLEDVFLELVNHE
ncbi:ABC transporter ATP-binding protein [Heyndrickxia oleronia]|uniref:ABC transporter n=1 Tax=Heyndrickxia oleronia TaxID=38875 RepID=A0A8E2I4K9_9BACI|nr:ABC transporter ATP-binding protein [Heyndrickxia oleronia]MEC1377241.1 ABC transporter ATP-binding protein [Heyndrickxia oleronia]OOP65970.1 ABC transporter [Heyndrickxia oleronia]QQZ07083.1 ABC transporter ATP-binding protein [Heyndrickxia oleronia]